MDYIIYLNKRTVSVVHFCAHVHRFCMEWTALSCKYKCLTLQFLQTLSEVMPSARS